MRWNHPRLGLMSPGQFLPLAEETGDIGALTAWVLDRAISQCAAWRERGFQLSMSVNVSPSNLVDTDLEDLVRRTLTRYSLPASALVLEITENWVISDFDGASQVMKKLSAIGVTVSIDDFGAGATSLSRSWQPAREGTET